MLGASVTRRYSVTGLASDIETSPLSGQNRATGARRTSRETGKRATSTKDKVARDTEPGDRTWRTPPGTRSRAIWRGRSWPGTTTRALATCGVGARDTETAVRAEAWRARGRGMAGQGRGPACQGQDATCQGHPGAPSPVPDAGRHAGSCATTGAAGERAGRGRAPSRGPRFTARAGAARRAR